MARSFLGEEVVVWAFPEMSKPHQVVNGPDDSWDSEDRKESTVFGELGGEIGNIRVTVAALGEEPFNPVNMADDVLEVTSCRDWKRSAGEERSWHDRAGEVGRQKEH